MTKLNEIRRFISLSFGICLMIKGILMLTEKSETAGSINIDFKFFSGEIESASAGLLIMFFAFFLIIVSIIQITPFKTQKHEISEQISKNEKDNIIKSHRQIELDRHHLRYFVVLLILWGVFVLSIFGAIYITELITMIPFFLGVVLLILTPAFISAYISNSKITFSSDNDEEK